MQAAAAIARVERDIGSVDFATIVRPGDRVLVGQGAAEPLTLTKQLVAQKDRIGPFEIFLGPLHSDTFATEKTAGIRFSSYGAIGRAASLSRSGRLDIVRQPYSALAEAFASGALKADVVLIQLAAPLPGRPPSFGLANDYLVAAARQARMVVAEINPDVPWTHGAEVPADFPLHLCVQAAYPPLDIASSPLSETERQIAARVASLVPNGAVLQFGVGAVPDAILAGLTQHRDLGIHSGLMTERGLDLIECGAVTNASKTFDRGVTVANILFGTPRLRAYAHDNPAFASPRRAIRMGSRCFGALRISPPSTRPSKSTSPAVSTARPPTDTISAPLAACAILSPAPTPPRRPRHHRVAGDRPHRTKPYRGQCRYDQRRG